MRLKLYFLTALLTVAGASGVLAQSNGNNTSNSTFGLLNSSPRSAMTNPLGQNPLYRNQNTLNAGVMLMLDELRVTGQPSSMIEPGARSIAVGAGNKKRGDIVASIPFRFSLLGKLTSTVRAGSDGSGPILVQAGTLGYIARRWQMFNGQEIDFAWCTMPSATIAGSPPAPTEQPYCLFALTQGGWRSAPLDGSFPDTLIAPRVRRANIADPEMELLASTQGPDQTLELRLENWTREGLFLKSYVNGRFVEVVGLPPNDTNQVNMTVSGQTLRFVRSQTRGEIATVAPTTP
jgi:hypothetical protein